MEIKKVRSEFKVKIESQNFDIVVTGGGLSGVAAAIASAREGAKVLLIEQYGFLGGMATAGLVNPFMPYAVWKARWEYDWEDKVNQGIFKEILKNLDAIGGLHGNNQTFNEELLKLILDRMIKKYKINVLLHSFVSGVTVNSTNIHTIMVTSKSGITQFHAKYFIDATGDADVSALAGCEFKVGREGDRYCQPMTLSFRLANVDKERFNNNTNKQAMNEKFKDFKSKGLITNPREDVLIFEHMVEDALHFNSTRIVKKSAINVEELTEAEIEAREQVFELYIFLKENIPGFENSQILMTAPQIGVRESRRIVGEYTIVEDDLLSAKKFQDSIARGTYPIDIHNPSGSGTVLKDIPYGDYYTIPYRALIPKGIDNLIVAGRPISATHEAHSAFRIMPICCSIGEGAGVAAAIAVKKKVSFRDISSDEIHVVLDSHCALY